MTHTARYELRQEGITVAAVEGPQLRALQEIMSYASQYEDDGPVEVVQVITLFESVDTE